MDSKTPNTNKEKVLYSQTVVVDIRPEKDDPNRVHITAVGERLDYYGETSTETCTYLVQVTVGGPVISYLSLACCTVVRDAGSLSNS